MANHVQDFTLMQLSSELGALLQERGWHLCTAESCTGGGIAAAVTSVPGSSDWFEYGLVTYANNAKSTLLDVDPELIRAQGAVSEAVVLQMVTGALKLSGADIAVSVSGIAGPEGGSRDKPVGTVWFAWGRADGWRSAKCYYFTGDRAKIRRQAVVVALRELSSICRQQAEPV